MNDKPTGPEAPQELPPGVPRPPSKDDVALVSRAQTILGDEWGENPPPEGKPASNPLG